jgi:hypothetical protein
MKKQIIFIGVFMLVVSISCEEQEKVKVEKDKIITEHYPELQMYVVKIPSSYEISTEGDSAENENTLKTSYSCNLIDKGWKLADNSSSWTFEQRTHLCQNQIALGFKARQYRDNCVGIALLKGFYNCDGRITRYANDSYEGAWESPVEEDVYDEGWAVIAPHGYVMWSIAVRSAPDDFRTVVMRYAEYNPSTRRMVAPPNTTYTQFEGTGPGDSGWNPHYRGEQYYDPMVVNLDRSRTVITGLGFWIRDDNVQSMQVRVAYLP